jgi:hypothetical protein
MTTVHVSIGSISMRPMGAELLRGPLIWIGGLAASAGSAPPQRASERVTLDCPQAQRLGKKHMVHLVQAGCQSWQWNSTYKAFLIVKSDIRILAFDMHA